MHSLIRKTLLLRHLSSEIAHSSRQTVVVLGTGWGSYSVLKNINKDKFDVVVVSPRNHFLFTPLLASTTVGTLEFRSIIEPVRNAGFRDDHHFHSSRAVDLDTSTQSLVCHSELDPSRKYSIQYDKLVIGVGAMSNTFGVPGVLEHAFFLKEISDARLIRNQILTNFELATQPGVSREEQECLLHLVIVGGGPTGIEFGAEFYDFLKQDLSRLYQSEKKLVKVTIIEAKQILSSFDEQLQKYAEAKISRRSQMEVLQDSVTEVTSKSVRLKSGPVIPCGLVVWSAGLAPRPFVDKLKLQKTPQGQILVNEYLQVMGEENVYALGDCASIADNPTPCTAQVAERQGKYVAKSLADSNPSPFVFKPFGMLAYIGEYKALTDTPVAKSQGFVSWVLWRSAYATKLGSWRLRMQVPFDWFKTFFFGRDTSKF